MQSTLGWHPKEIKILVVDDEPTARIVVRKLLEKTGYTGTPSLYCSCAQPTLVDLL
jgi:CheY-like chemotaxis protein